MAKAKWRIGYAVQIGMRVIYSVIILAATTAIKWQSDKNLMQT